MEKAALPIAYMIAFDDQHQEHIFPVEGKDLRVGDLVLLKAGEQAPADCKILHGQVWVTRSGAEGEKTLVSYGPPQVLPALSLVERGTAKAYIASTDANT